MFLSYLRRALLYVSLALLGSYAVSVLPVERFSDLLAWPQVGLGMGGTALFWPLTVDFFAFVYYADKVGGYSWREVVKNYFRGYRVSWLQELAEHREQLVKEILWCARKNATDAESMEFVDTVQTLIRRHKLMEIMAWYSHMREYEQIQLEERSGERQKRLEQKRRAVAGSALQLAPVLRQEERSLHSNEREDARELEQTLARMRHLASCREQVPEEAWRLLEQLPSLKVHSRQYRKARRRLELLLAEPQAKAQVKRVGRVFASDFARPQEPEPSAALMLSKMENGLPLEFRWGNDRGDVSYSVPFLTSLGRLSKADQSAVIKQINMLAECGPRYPSLKTKTVRQGGVPFTPDECFVSRAKGNIRFSWTKVGEVRVHFIFAKNDNSVAYGKQGWAAK